MQNKNILKLHNKYHNVVDLHDAKPVLGKEEKVVDLRARQRVFNKEEFEQSLRSSVKSQGARYREIRKPVKINLTGLVSKSIALLLLVSLNSFAISQVGNTFSVFGDTEISQNNSFVSGVLDFDMTVSPFNNDAWTNLIPGTTTAQDVDVVPNIVSNPFVYFASSTNFTGDDDFCSVVHVLATLDGEVMYDGLLKDMITGTTTNLMAWNFEFSTNTSFFNSMCHFDIDWNGWQTRHDYPNYHDGYSDTETTTHWLFADGLKINKVYFEKPDREIPHCRCNNPDHAEYGDDGEYHCEGYEPDVNVVNDNESNITTEITDSANSSGGDGQNVSNTNEVENVENLNTYTDEWIIEDHEWVELYNPNNEFADINGWFVCDGQSCDELITTEPIPPFGYAIIYADDQVLHDWNVPEDFVKIKIADGAIGDGLDNENDGLTLLRPDFFNIDHVNWGVPDNTWPYYDPLFWNPGVVVPELGNMIARVPAGTDTNTVDDWFELSIPTLELLYPGLVVFEPWFWDYTYLVTWVAENPNGPDEDLTVDLILIRDTNYNYKIDDEDERIVLAQGVANDGNEEVTVPDGFIGMVWLEYVVTGPENPMVQTNSHSGFMFTLWPPHAQDDEEQQETMREAVTYEMQMTGESEYAYILPEPFVPEEKATTTDKESPTRDDIRRERLERGNFEESDSATTSALTLDAGSTTPMLTGLLRGNGSSTEPFLEEEHGTTTLDTESGLGSTTPEKEVVSSTTPAMPEVKEEQGTTTPTFKEEIFDLIEDENKEAEEKENSESGEEIASTTTPVIIEEELLPTQESDE